MSEEIHHSESINQAMPEQNAVAENEEKSLYRGHNTNEQQVFDESMRKLEEGANTKECVRSLVKMADIPDEKDREQYFAALKKYAHKNGIFRGDDGTREAFLDQCAQFLTPQAKADRYPGTSNSSEKIGEKELKSWMLDMDTHFIVTMIDHEMSNEQAQEKARSWYTHHTSSPSRENTPEVSNQSDQSLPYEEGDDETADNDYIINQLVEAGLDHDTASQMVANGYRGNEEQVAGQDIEGDYPGGNLEYGSIPHGNRGNELAHTSNMSTLNGLAHSVSNKLGEYAPQPKMTAGKTIEEARAILRKQNKTEKQTRGAQTIKPSTAHHQVQSAP